MHPDASQKLQYSTFSNMSSTLTLQSRKKNSQKQSVLYEEAQYVQMDHFAPLISRIKTEICMHKYPDVQPRQFS